MVKKMFRKIFPKKKKIEPIPPEGYIVPETCSVPPTCIIKKSSNLIMGKHIAFNDFVFVNAFGGVEIGDYTAIGPFTMIHSANHNYKDKSKLIQEQGHTKLPVKIGKDVLISANVTILYGSVIPDGCVIGANSLITRKTKMEPYCVYAGNPAKKISARE